MNFDPESSVQSLYIHWPFCPYKCNFCPFVALAGHDQFMERYHQVLKKEILDFSNARQKKLPLSTIFMGGGTPSTYPPNLLLDTFGTLYNVFEIDSNAEISIEVNPGTVTQEKLETWKQAGINRLSIGVQSLNDTVLKKLNRHQSAQSVLELLESAEKLFDNISVDLIVGLPGISDVEWKELIEKVVTWPIKHVSMYFLTVHEDTPLYFGVKTQKIILPSDETIVDLYYWTIEKFAQHGIYQYEISNFARENYYSRHNSIYWQRKPYKGVGLGACSFDGRNRLQNEKSLLKYLEGIENNKCVTAFSEELTDKQVWLEVLMLGLRQTKGVLINAVLEPLDEKQKKKFCETLDIMRESKLITYDQDRILLTPAGLSVVNEIIIKLSEF